MPNYKNATIIWGIIGVRLVSGMWCVNTHRAKDSVVITAEPIMKLQNSVALSVMAQRKKKVAM